MPAAHPLIRKPIVEQLFRYLESSGIDATPYRDACCWQAPEIEGLEPAIDVSAFFEGHINQFQMHVFILICNTIGFGVDWARFEEIKGLKVF